MESKSIHRIGITGASGFLGTALTKHLTAQDKEVIALPRALPKNSSDLENFDAVINLAGEGLFKKRWSTAQKQALYESRVHTTKAYCEAFANARHPPKVILSASAVGYYGDRGDEKLTEHSKHGLGVLSEIARAWEDATLAASQRGIRVCQMRLGVVLDKSGGALKNMLPAFRLGVGAILGNGKQFFPWIALADVIGIIDFLLSHTELEGPFNIVSPNALTNEQFSKALASALSRPCLLKVPTWALKLMLGEAADETFLNSTNAYPLRLLHHGYEFLRPKVSSTF